MSAWIKWKLHQLSRSVVSNSFIIPIQFRIGLLCSSTNATNQIESAVGLFLSLWNARMGLIYNFGFCVFFYVFPLLFRYIYVHYLQFSLKKINFEIMFRFRNAGQICVVVNSTGPKRFLWLFWQFVLYFTRSAFLQFCVLFEASCFLFIHLVIFNQVK